MYFDYQYITAATGVLEGYQCREHKYAVQAKQTIKIDDKTHHAKHKVFAWHTHNRDKHASKIDEI